MAVTARVLPFLALLAVVGCGGDKADFTSVPKSYATTLVSPEGATAITVKGVSRDGRIVGKYTKDGKDKLFGWLVDGDTTDIVLPAECKDMDGIDDIGNLICSDRTVIPTKLFLYKSGNVESLALPSGYTDVTVNQMTATGGIAVTASKTGETKGYLMRIGEDPVVKTDAGGATVAVSAESNVACNMTANGHVSCFAVIGDKKGPVFAVANGDVAAAGINDAGVMVATKTPSGDVPRAVKITGPDMALLPLPPGATESVATDIENGGLIGGRVKVGAEWEACVWFPKGEVALVKNLVKPSLPGVKYTNVRVVTPLGIVVCEGTKTTGNVTVPILYALNPSY